MFQAIARSLSFKSSFAPKKKKKRQEELSSSKAKSIQKYTIGAIGPIHLHTSIASTTTQTPTNIGDSSDCGCCTGGFYEPRSAGATGSSCVSSVKTSASQTNSKQLFLTEFPATTLLRSTSINSNFTAHNSLPDKQSEVFHPAQIRSSPRKSPGSDITSQAPPPSQPLLLNNDLGIMQRKIWVKRNGASATLVAVNVEDLVDTVRDVILQKYANSLGRTIDSPDITLRIYPRDQANKTSPVERILGPEENIGHVLDECFPGGQTINEALVIDVPQRRTPKASPRPGIYQIPYHIPDEYRPGDGARDYFPPMPLHSPLLSHAQHSSQPNGLHLPHSMSVLATGQLPPLPSPGGHSARRHPRPKYGRQHTSSPTILHSTQSNDLKSQLNGIPPPAPPLPTPPVPAEHKTSITPPNRATSPHAGRSRKKKQNASTRSTNGDPQLPKKSTSANLMDGTVPPINVLLVEDNVINLKLLEAFMKRLKVRWKAAMNGREAVNMWRTGGFHLVLMDIQLPVMNGLEATKEIRRLESVNGIGLGVFGGASANGKRSTNTQLVEEDTLQDRSLFKSPVIIVALTASSLQSDRHEALAAGCNDFLTKPVNFLWMERKVTEWGCMQALIDFDGWRKWKEYANKKNAMDPEQKKQEEKDEKAKSKAALKAMFSRPPPVAKKDTPEKKDKDKKSEETGTRPPATLVGKTLKGGRSGSGSVIGGLESTPEVDEKS